MVVARGNEEGGGVEAANRGRSNLLLRTRFDCSNLRRGDASP